MTYLLDRVRTMVNDVPAEVINLTNQQIQDALDEHRKERRYEPLEAISTVLAGGSVVYKTFQAPYGTWEGARYDAGGSAAYYGGTAGLLLLDGTYGTVTPETSDPLRGRWTFGTAPTRPVMIVGYYYDVYGAAADLLEIRASQVSEHFDFKDQGQEFTRSQKQKMVMEVANRYRQKQWAGFVEIGARSC